MNSQTHTLADLGWTQFYQSQLSIEDIESLTALRVTEVHRNAMETIGQNGPQRVHMTGEFSDNGVAVGDWIMVETETGRAERILERKSEIKRRAAGDQPTSQLIAANIDTLFIVSSCNADYNPARLERYLALARQAQVDPVIILTKADLHEDPAEYLERARTDLPGVLVETIDAKNPDTINQLAPWCGKGQTLALVGSSGVGKTTLMNLLTGESELTLDIREDDAKGRHTTTARSMYRIPLGGWLIDTPGMRALRLYDVGEGIEMVFEDLATLAEQCKFNDCAHASEPGCAIQAAIAAGDMDEARLHRWQKLQREDQFHTETIAERHNRTRQTEKKYRTGKANLKAKRGDFA